MNLIKHSSRRIDEHNIPIISREINSANILHVEAGTNGYHGGDTGHGCRTYFQVVDLGGTDIQVRPVGRNNRGFEVVLSGDYELETIIQALGFVVRVLKKQADANN